MTFIFFSSLVKYTITVTFTQQVGKILVLASRIFSGTTALTLLTRTVLLFYVRALFLCLPSLDTSIALVLTILGTRGSQFIFSVSFGGRKGSRSMSTSWQGTSAFHGQPCMC